MNTDRKKNKKIMNADRKKKNKRKNGSSGKLYREKMDEQNVKNKAKRI